MGSRAPDSDSPENVIEVGTISPYEACLFRRVAILLVRTLKVPGEAAPRLRNLWLPIHELQHGPSYEA